MLPHLGGDIRSAVKTSPGLRRNARRFLAGPLSMPWWTGRGILNMKTILMTGAAGRIGTFLRPELAGKYTLGCPISRRSPICGPARLSCAPIFPSLRHAAAHQSVDAVVHFGANPASTIGTTYCKRTHRFHNTLEAARINGVKRFLVATSTTRSASIVRSDDRPHRLSKPRHRYGVSKVFNEACRGLYADRTACRCSACASAT